MGLGRCDCCGKQEESIAPIGVPLGVPVTHFQRLYFLCENCIDRLSTTQRKIRTQIDTWNLYNKSAEDE